MTGSIELDVVGEVDGSDVQRFTLTSPSGLMLHAINYGATVTGLLVPERDGALIDVVLGFERVEDYFGEHPYLGCVVGRVANRIMNAEFTLDGERYVLPSNDGPHHLHGGPRGFHKVVWDAEANTRASGPEVTFRHRSHDGKAGYPGNLDAQVTYRLEDGNRFVVEMQATTDRPTLVNLAQHCYWNLAGAGDVLEHELTLYASRFTPGAPVVPDGRVEPVRGTPFDFTRQKRIADDVIAAGGEPSGFDHNFVIDGEPGALRPVAELVHPPSGRVMTLASDQPGVQFYSGNFLDGSLMGKGGQMYQKHAGLCLETQAFPNAVNVPTWREQVILRPGQEYRHVMVFEFSAAKYYRGKRRPPSTGLFVSTDQRLGMEEALFEELEH